MHRNCCGLHSPQPVLRERYRIKPMLCTPAPPPPPGSTVTVRQVYQVARVPLADYLASVADASLDFIFITAPQHGPEELDLLPGLWRKLRPQGYIGGYWWSDCTDWTRGYCRAAGQRVVQDVKGRVLAFATSVGRQVQPTTAGHVKSWYFVK